MAINKTINKRTMSHAAMRNCLEYVLRTDKTEESLTYMTGPAPIELTYDTVYNSFLDEKRIWNKDSGRMYAHNIISWHKNERISLSEALQFAIEFAEEWFKGFQTLIAVHKDRDHIHIHLVTNTVSYEDGYKLHCTRKDLERMKELTNQMCESRGLSTAEKGKDFYGNNHSKGEVTAWSKDKYHLIVNDTKKAFLADCAIAYIQAVDSVSSRDEFISLMNKAGWEVIWTEKKKHITFVDSAGNKVRDTNLAKTFNVEVSKEYIENECNGKGRERTELSADVESERATSVREQPAVKQKQSIRDKLNEGKRKVEETNREREKLEIKPKRDKKPSR